MGNESNPTGDPPLNPVPWDHFTEARRPTAFLEKDLKDGLEKDLREPDSTTPLPRY